MEKFPEIINSYRLVINHKATLSIKNHEVKIPIAIITLKTGTRTSSLTKGCNCPVNAAQSSGTLTSFLLFFLELLCARRAD
jgi:hypothetical protein